MAQLQGFPSCCGAQILTGLYREKSGLGAQYEASYMPKKEDFYYFTVAITNSGQHGNTGVVKALQSRGFEQVLEFRGNGDTELHLWAQGREWKPLAGVKGNMKPRMECLCGPDDAMSEAKPCAFCTAVEKEVAKRVKKISFGARYGSTTVPRQPAGKKSQTRRSTHGRGSSSSRSRTETSA